MPPAPRLPKTVTKESSIAQMPIGTKVLVRGKRNVFTYTRTQAGWEQPSAVTAWQQTYGAQLAETLGQPTVTGPVRTSRELAETITRLGTRPATVIAPH